MARPHRHSRRVEEKVLACEKQGGAILRFALSMERQLKERRVHTLAHHGHQRIGVRRSLPAVLPEGWTLENLLADHASTPYNPALANAFFRAGEIETWGRGIQRIFEACENAGTPAPIIASNQDHRPQTNRLLLHPAPHRGLHGGRITQSPFGKKINHREHREHRERKKPKADSL